MQQLLDAIHANLADDGPRLVYADHLQQLGDPRGELIAVQCELARLGHAIKPERWDWIGDALADDADPTHLRKLRAREAALLKLDKSFVQVDETVFTVRTERGFVTHVDVPGAAELGSHMARLLARFPTIDSLGMPSLVRAELPAVFAWPGFASLRALRMPLFGVEGLSALASARLRELSLWCSERTDSHHAAALFAWPPFAGITSLEITSAGLTPADASALVARCGPLDELQLRLSRLGPEGATALAGAEQLANLRILSLLGNKLGGKGTAAICQLAQLRALDLRRNTIGVEGATALAEHPALRTLDLTGNSINAKVMAALCGGRGLGKLRELCLQATHVDDAALAILARSPLLGRLTSLNLRSNKLTDVGARALAGSPLAANLRALNLNNNAITAAGKQVLDASRYLEHARISLRPDA